LVAEIFELSEQQWNILKLIPIENFGLVLSQKHSISVTTSKFVFESELKAKLSFTTLSPYLVRDEQQQQQQQRLSNLLLARRRQEASNDAGLDCPFHYVRWSAPL
jgi:hypothetical protein